MTQVYIVRHPEATGNLNNVFQGSINCDVTKTGEKQLFYVAERFKNIKIDSIYTSPLKRAYKTALAINKYHNVNIIKQNGLLEIDGGTLEGVSFNTIYKTMPNIYDIWKNKPHLFEYETAESMKDFHKRVVDCFLKIVSQNKNKTIVLTTHGCVIRSIVCCALGKDITNLTDVAICPNTGVSLLLFNKNEKVAEKIEYLADISHLPDNYKTFFKHF